MKRCSICLSPITPESATDSGIGSSVWHLRPIDEKAISLAKLEELFATVLEKPRGEIALAEFGVVTDEAPTPVRIPA